MNFDGFLLPYDAIYETQRYSVKSETKITVKA